MAVELSGRDRQIPEVRTRLRMACVVIIKGSLHDDRHHHARPDLGDLAVAAAELDGHPLADQPGRLRQAAAEIAANHPAASPDDVLLWAEARALPAA